ncbi:MAG: GH3 auxin-responsive promoter family protein [Bacteroidota bacterium]
MAFVGKIFKGAVHLNEKLRRTRKDISQSQEETLRKLLKKATKTAFGKSFGFENMLKSSGIKADYSTRVPLFDYDSIFEQWWHRSLAGERDVCWPGKVSYFALSSGTTGASSKQIPVTLDMLMAMRKAGFWHWCTLKNHNMPGSFYQKQILMLGGSTHFTQLGNIYEGDLSGILTGNLPYWINFFYKPGREIAKERDWNSKLNMMVRAAAGWDIGIVTGVPAWVQILIERIIDHYRVSNIHDIWPNFNIYVHGGVCFKPYKENFSRLLGREVICLDTYLASEGFIAFEKLNGTKSMSLVLDNGIYYEFIPFNNENFTIDGNLKPCVSAVPMFGVEEEKEYAIVLSTCAGAWRYIIGDTVRFTNVEKQELVITGRIKHFMNLCGEHLSVDNMNQAICQVASELDMNIKEFALAGIPYKNLFAHKWYIGAEQSVDKQQLRNRLDEALLELNDDYRTERKAAIKEVLVEMLPNETFYEWMKLKGKLGGQHKFPRVLRGEQLKEWENFLYYEKPDQCRMLP